MRTAASRAAAARARSARSVFLARLPAACRQHERLIRAASACFIVVYVFALASAARLLAGSLRAAAALSLALVCVVAVFSSAYLAVPAGAALARARRQVRRRSSIRSKKTPQPRFAASDGRRQEAVPTAGTASLSGRHGAR
jgi:hypothetical protein